MVFAAALALGALGSGSCANESDRDGLGLHNVHGGWAQTVERIAPCAASALDGKLPGTEACRPCRVDADCAQGSVQCFNHAGESALLGDTLCLKSVCVPCATLPDEPLYYCAVVQRCSDQGLGCNDDSPACVDPCLDHMRDLDETDVDCGGDNTCPRCSDGQYCDDDADCAQGLGCSQQDYTCGQPIL